jgi:hypothetical protein
VTSLATAQESRFKAKRGKLEIMSPTSKEKSEQGVMRRRIQNATSIQELGEILNSLELKYPVPLTGSLDLEPGTSRDGFLAELLLHQKAAQRTRKLIDQGKIRRGDTLKSLQRRLKA